MHLCYISHTTILTPFHNIHTFFYLSKEEKSRGLPFGKAVLSPFLKPFLNLFPYSLQS